MPTTCRQLPVQRTRGSSRGISRLAENMIRSALGKTNSGCRDHAKYRRRIDLVADTELGTGSVAGELCTIDARLVQSCRATATIFGVIGSRSAGGARHQSPYSESPTILELGHVGLDLAVLSRITRRFRERCSADTRWIVERDGGAALAAPIAARCRPSPEHTQGPGTWPARVLSPPKTPRGT
jgi:hypothetical protein